MRESTSMTPRWVRAAAVTAAILIAGGCLKGESTLSLKADGSGTWRQVTTVNMEKAEAYLSVLSGQVRELEPVDDVRARHDDMFPDLDVEKRKKALANRRGVHVLEATGTSDKKKKTHTSTLAVRFDSLKALFESGAVEDATATLEKTKQGAWKLTIRHAHLEGAVEAAADKLREVREGVLHRFKPYWSGLTVDIALELPTLVIDTNGLPKGRSVTWQVRFADLADPKKLVHEVTFQDAAGLKLKPFSAGMVEAEEAAAAGGEKK